METIVPQKVKAKYKRWYYKTPKGEGIITPSEQEKDCSTCKFEWDGWVRFPKGSPCIPCVNGSEWKPKEKEVASQPPRVIFGPNTEKIKDIYNADDGAYALKMMSEVLEGEEPSRIIDASDPMNDVIEKSINPSEQDLVKCKHFDAGICQIGKAYTCEYQHGCKVPKEVAEPSFGQDVCAFELLYDKYKVVEKADLKELIEIGYCTQTSTMLNFVNKMEKKYLTEEEEKDE
jgi:hypothetical protein